jgi:hypothetical protein
MLSWADMPGHVPVETGQLWEQTLLRYSKKPCRTFAPWSDTDGSACFLGTGSWMRHNLTGHAVSMSLIRRPDPNRVHLRSKHERGKGRVEHRTVGRIAALKARSLVRKSGFL